MSKRIEYKKVNGNRMLMLEVPTIEDMEQIYVLMKEYGKLNSELSTMKAAWASCRQKTIVLMQDTGSIYYREIGDSTYESYKSALVPLDEFYSKYDFQQKLENFGEALTKLETQLTQ